jgi:hypothetical protein
MWPDRTHIEPSAIQPRWLILGLELVSPRRIYAGARKNIPKPWPPCLIGFCHFDPSSSNFEGEIFNRWININFVEAQQLTKLRIMIMDRHG